jgi:glycosyltransferase involved in cell wall biosynthesis
MSLVAKAFTKLPNKRLVIVGDGPEKNKILQIINNYKNIKLLVNVNDNELQDLYSNCFALIYMPVNEDFGLVPLEGMASGKICIAANEGGCKETVIDGKTGFLITASEKNIINTINKLNIKKVEKMKDDCIRQANKFNIDDYAKKWNDELK